MDIHELKRMLLDECVDNEDDEEYELELVCDPVFKDGRIVAIVTSWHCECGEIHQGQIFTDGSDDELEDILIDAGYRDFEIED